MTYYVSSGTLKEWKEESSQAGQGNVIRLVDEQNGLFTAKENDRRQNWTV